MKNSFSQLEKQTAKCIANTKIFLLKPAVRISKRGQNVTENLVGKESGYIKGEDYAGNWP